MAALSDTLKTLYYSERGYTSPARLLKAVRAIHPHATLKQVEHWYSTQEVPGRYRQRRLNFPRSVFMTRARNVEWLSDLAMFPHLRGQNKGYLYLLVVQDLFSRKVLGLQPMRNKQSKTVAENLRKVIEDVGRAPLILFTDAGAEYLGSCTPLYAEFGIKHVAAKDIATKAAPTERLILHLKQKIYKQMAYHHTRNWTRFLEPAMHSVNAEYHRVLGMTRNEAYMKANQNKVFRAISNRETQLLAAHKKPYKFKVGDVVRVSRDQGPFAKSFYGTFSDALYKVVKREMSGGVPVYTLADYLLDMPLNGRWYGEELRLVRNVRKKQAVQQVHSFRLTPDERQELQVTFAGSKVKKWVAYSDLIEYE